ncbi:MAG: hypothetical protein HY553_05040 [Elusimicrobia bacterium]|nr:hypothetical protein [Elusimicrobiota bacterium]
MPPWRVAAALGFVTLAAFWPALGVGFLHLDDHANILANPAVRQGLGVSGLSWAFTTFRGQIWNPLLWLSYMLDVELYGLEPRGFHFTSVLLHAVAAAALFEALRRMTGRLWESAAAAAAFALHPTRVESVAWLAQRYDVLYALFSFAAIGVYARWVRRPSLRVYSALAAVYALALMSKGLAVTLPALLLILDYWPLGRLSWRNAGDRIREKLPLVAMAVAAAALVLRARGELLASAPVEPAWTRLAAVPAYLLAYLRNGLAPWLLPTCFQADSTFSAAFLFACAWAFAALMWAAWRARLAAPYVLAGWLWFACALGPVSGLAFPSGMASRYLYVPLVGLAFAGAWGGAELLRRRRVPAGATAAACALLLAGGFALTRRELSFWQDHRTLYSRWLGIAPGNRLLHNILGVVHAERGELGPAERHFREALRLSPDYDDARRNLERLLYGSR